METAAKVTALTSLPALLAAPCLSSLALAAAGVAALVCGYLLAGLDARREWNAEADYVARVEAMAAAYAEHEGVIDYPQEF